MNKISDLLKICNFSDKLSDSDEQCIMIVQKDN